jgi:glutathione-regulated potassium-efflux system ancillary protein KefC
MDNGLLFNTFIFLAAACLVVPLASRFRLGSVLGYLIAGVLIGPFGFHFIGNAQEVMHFAEFGVIMMLFLIGLELEPAVLWRMRRSIVGLGGLQIAVTGAAFTAIGIALGYDWRVSLAVALALALSSTALVLQILQEKNLMHTSMGETAFAVLLFQDIAVIPILVLMPLLSADGAAAGPHTDGMLAHLPGWVQAMAVAAVITLVVIAGRYLSRHMFHFIAKTNLREVFTAMSLALVVGITLLMQMIGISPALGAFIAGVVLANSSYKHTLETDIEPFKSLLLGLFFISVGMGMNFSLFAQSPARLLTAVALLMAVKATILCVLGRCFGLTGTQNIGFALALSQGGEFAFVLFQYAGGLFILDAAQSAFLMLTVAISIALTPLLMAFYSRFLVPRFMSVLPERDYDAIAERNPVILAGYGRFGQVIGRFLTAQGVKITVLEKDPDQIEMLRKYGRHGYFGDASRLDLLKSAGAEAAKLLIIAVDDADTCLEIARLAKEKFPHLKIFARARNRRHAYELHRAGVHYFRRETFDSSLAMAQEIMAALGHDREAMQQKALAFIRHDEEILQKSFAFFEQEPELISFSRQASGELERILQSDVPETASK